MPLLYGPHWRNGSPAAGWVEVARDRIVAEGPGPPPSPGRRAVLIDGLTNHHSHVGDAVLRGRRLPHDLAALVTPGTGLKHRVLATMPASVRRLAMVRQLRRYAAHGITEILDFREQGVEGLRYAAWAAARVPGLGVRLLGRPQDATATRAGLGRLLRHGDGLAAPSLHDWGASACREMADAAHRAGRPFALHASEGLREPMEDVLRLRPDLLVHLCHATEEDIERVARARVPVAVCPTSNRFFGLRPPIDLLERAGVAWYLGTDNAMLGSDDLLDEARQLRRWLPRIPDASILRALTTPLRKSIKRFGRLEPRSPSGPLLALSADASGRVRWNARPRLLRR